MKSDDASEHKADTLEIRFKDGHPIVASRDIILIWPSPQESQTESGLIIPEQYAKEILEQQHGLVVVVGLNLPLTLLGTVAWFHPRNVYPTLVGSGDKKVPLVVGSLDSIWSFSTADWARSRGVKVPSFGEVRALLGV